MEHFTPETIDFMFELRMNNNKEWMNENRQRYIDLLKKPMDAFSEKMLEVIHGFGTGHTFIGSVSRINRDIRFSKDKSPYKARKWAVWRQDAPEHWKIRPVFFFEIAPEDYSYGLGIYEARPAYMQKFRAKIDADTAGTERLIKEFNRQNRFEVIGDKYKKKMGQEKNPIVQDWYCRKSISFITRCPLEERVFSTDLPEQIGEEFKQLLPYYYFLNGIELSE